ncbi:hypothetical protein BKA66DRAFT_570007 [Pyrenochaeta sp. MPI-SDFR-AT-0127]|nr:hypothetical protein BKA66DRAFT_570007 [Pyrenochaeta sp. MPI-SDFR-AT-0127]
MSIPNLAAPALLAAALAPPLLPPYCTSTITVSLSVVANINTVTWTYTGPSPGQPTTAFVLEPTTTYTIVLPTRDLIGGSGSQAYTVIGPPLGEPSQCPSLPQNAWTDLPARYFGCVQDLDANNQPLFDGPSDVTDSEESCRTLCTTIEGGPYKFFGIKSGSDCHCGNEFLHDVLQEPANECDTPCLGNAMERCGGSLNRMSIFQNPDWSVIQKGDSSSQWAQSLSLSGDYSSLGSTSGSNYPQNARDRPPPGVNKPPSAPGDGVDGELESWENLPGPWDKPSDPWSDSPKPRRDFNGYPPHKSRVGSEKSHKRPKKPWKGSEFVCTKTIAGAAETCHIKKHRASYPHS